MRHLFKLVCRDNMFQVATALILAGCTGSLAMAQVNVEMLLSSSVEKVGPEHKKVADAIELFKTNKLLEARTLLEEASKENPNLPPSGVLMANLLLSANQVPLARSELERAVQEAPDDPEAYLAFGELASRERRFTDAQLQFLRAASKLREYKQNPVRRSAMMRRAYSGMALVYEVRDQWEEAAKYLDEVVKANPEDESTVTRCARTLLRLGKTNDALSELKKLKQSKPDVRQPEVTLGLLFQESNNEAEAKKMMMLAAQNDQSDPVTQLTVARWAVEAGELDLARKCSARATEVAGDSVDAKLLSALIARLQKNYAEAESTLKQAHLQSPLNLGAMLQLAVVMIEQPGKERDAVEYAQAATRIYSDLSDATGREAAVTLAWVLFRGGRMAEAQQILQRALTGGAVTAESAYYAGRILYQSGNREVAKQYLEKSLATDRVFPGRAEAEQMLQSAG